MSILSSTNKVIIKKVLLCLTFIGLFILIIGIETHEFTMTSVEGISKESIKFEDSQENPVNWTSIVWENDKANYQSETLGYFDAMHTTTFNSYIVEEYRFFKKVKTTLNLNQRDRDFIYNNLIPHNLNSTQIIELLDDGRNGKVISNLMFLNSVKYTEFHLIFYNEPFFNQPLYSMSVQISDPMNIPDYLILK